MASKTFFCYRNLQQLLIRFHCRRQINFSWRKTIKSIIPVKSRFISPVFVSLLPVVQAAWGFGTSKEENMSQAAPGNVVIEQADALYEQFEFLKLYDLLIKQKDCGNDEILWRLARACLDKSKMASVSKEDAKALVMEGFEIAKRALELNDNNYACHKWYAILLSKRDDYIGTKQKIEDSPALKKHFERASELNPNDPTTIHLLGMWCYSFADLAWYERKIAAVVFGSPPESTYQEALEFFEKAEKMDPNFYSTNMYMIGMCNLKLGKKDKAKEWFTKLLNYNVKTEEDKENVKKTEDHLKSL